MALYSPSANALETTDIIKKMLVAMVSYGMSVVKFRSKTLKAMNEAAAKAIASHAKMYGAHFLPNFCPAKLDGGLGLYDMFTIQDAQLIRTWQAVLNGPDCQAKSALRQYEREHNCDGNSIRFGAENSVWSPFLRALANQDLMVNTTQRPPVNDALRKRALDDLKDSEDWPQLQALLADNGIAQDPSPVEAYSALRAIKVHRRPTGTLALLAPDTYAQIKERLRHFSLIDSAMRTSPDNFSQGADDEAPQDIDFTAGLPQKLNARIHSTITLDGLQFLIVCTDGSFKSNDLGDQRIATWAAVCPHVNHARNNSFGVFGLVEGAQDNDRAELVAILETLKRIKPSETSPNILIVTDSESSVNSIRSWPQSKQLKTPNRDVIRGIHELLYKHDKRRRAVKFAHIPSHTLDQETYQKKIDRVRQAIQLYGEDAFRHMQIGNDIADKIAQAAAARAIHPRARNYHKSPTPTLDEYYITHEGSLVDKPIHPFVKNLHSKRALKLITSKIGARAEIARLANDPTVDKKLSFGVDNSDPEHHGTLSTLATVRFHAYPTLKKLHDLSKSGKKGIAKQKYFQAMYPDADCPYCPGVTEDTRHMITCPNRPTRQVAATALRKELLALVAKERTAPSAAPIEALPLIGVFTSDQVASRDAIVQPLLNRRRFRGLTSLANDPCPALEYGIIPSALPRCLRELGVKKPKRLARTIATKAQRAIANELKARRKHISTARNQAQLFRTHALGKHPHALPQQQPLPAAQPPPAPPPTPPPAAPAPTTHPPAPPPST